MEFGLSVPLLLRPWQSTKFGLTWCRTLAKFSARSARLTGGAVCPRLEMFLRVWLVILS